ncbi:MAG: lipoate protein ligase C-terminal domain-containing protein [Owenweeksia sp.]|nr:lipoate protein ligase C-terminal domain-containing protein [Owenweeksia sp.]
MPCLISLPKKISEAIQKLADTKYSQWNWNFGYSPRYGLKRGVKTPGGHVEVHLNVDKGLITDLAIFGDFFVNRELDDLKRAMVGVEHREESVLAVLHEIGSSALILKILLKRNWRQLFFN